MVQRRLALTVCVAALSLPALAGAQAVRRGDGATGFTTNSLARNDDESTGLVDVGFALSFFGNNYSQLYVNNNGNVTFGQSLGEYTPFGLTGNTGIPIIAAYFADVDIRGAASALTTYGTGMIGGHNAFGVNWDGVGYFDSHTDQLNVFQEILIDRSDTGAGNFDIEFNYDRVRWETGDASDGINGFGGTSAAVGYSAGTGAAGTYAQLVGSFVNGALLDNGPNALVRGSQGSDGVLGRYVFNVRNGAVVIPPTTTVPEPTTVALVGLGVMALGAATRRRTRR